MSALSGEDGIEEATKRGMSGSKLKKNTERQNRLRPPTAVACQIGGIGGVILPHLSICKVCALYSTDELLRWKERQGGKMGGAKCEWCEWDASE